jgi:chemotaxis protein MotB
MAGKGGGAWKVAYADFVTAMMAFFLVMWITAQNTKVKSAIAHYFNQESEPPKRPFRGPRDETSEPPKFILQPVTPSLTEDPNDPESRVPRVLTIRESDQTSMATVVYFADGSAELDEPAKKRLRRLLPWIVGKPHKLEIRGHAPDSATAITVAESERGVAGAERGHTPSIFPNVTPAPPQARAASARDSWQLAYARCLTVRIFLETQGIAAHRLRMSQAGPHEPLTNSSLRNSSSTNGLSTSSGDPVWQTRNPRVEIFVLSEHVKDYVGTRDERAKQEESH